MTKKNFTAYRNVEAGLSRLPSIQDYMEKRLHPSFYLDRVHHMLDLLHHPEKGFKYIHVGGTAGKGSVTVFLHNMFRASGKRVGSCISPHVTTLSERTLINARPVSADDIIWAWKKIQPAIRRAQTRGRTHAPSYFEANFLMSLLLFHKHRVQWAIIEVGCGGEFDATNVIPSSRATIITNVHLDHTQLLGRTRRAIAKTKAGIIKQTPYCFTGESDPTIRSIIKKKADAAGAKCIYVPQPSSTPIFQNGRMQWTQTELATISSRLLGKQYMHNAELAITVARHMGISKRACRNGISLTRLPGRTEYMSHHPDVLLDGAHNPAKMEALLQSLAPLAYRSTIAIVGIGKAKQHTQILSRLVPRIDNIIFTKSKVDIPEPANPFTLNEIWKTLTKKPSRVIARPQAAVTAGLKACSRDTLLLITGSLYLVGDIRTRWIPEARILKSRNLFPR